MTGYRVGPPPKIFRHCPDCGHANYVTGCECTHRLCRCVRRKREESIRQPKPLRPPSDT